jgi:hypothetical protein
MAMTTRGMELIYPPTNIKASPIIMMNNERANDFFLPNFSVKVEKISIPEIDPTNTSMENRFSVLEC